MCFLPNCRYHKKLIGNNKEWLKNGCFLFQLPTRRLSVYTFQVPIQWKFVVKSGQLFGNVQRAPHFNHQNRGKDRRHSIAKKRLLRKKYKKHLLSSARKTKSTQTTGSVFVDRIEHFKKTKFELEPIKIVECFLDDHGNYTSNLVSFKNKSMNTNDFLNSKEFCKNQLVNQMI